MLDGSCLCRAISYRVEEDITELILCHCSFCRKATGSAFSVNARVHQDNVTLLAGDDQLVSYRSSPGKKRFYCQICHSQLFHLQETLPNMMTLKMGTIDYSSQNLSVVPKRHIFEDDQFSWLSD